MSICSKLAFPKWLKKNESGFTLIELLIVVAIIAILSAVGIPLYQGYQANAKVAGTIPIYWGHKSIEDDFNKCLDFEDLENYILNTRIEAVQKYKIKSTPTLVINDKIFKDTLEYKNIKKIIEKLI